MTFENISRFCRLCLTSQSKAQSHNQAKKQKDFFHNIGFLISNIFIVRFIELLNIWRVFESNTSKKFNQIFMCHFPICFVVCIYRRDSCNG